METTDKSFLLKKRLYIFDLDGTIYLDGELFPKSRDLLAKIRSLSGDYVFFTNNSSKSTQAYVEKIQSLNIPCTKANMATSTEALIDYINSNRLNLEFYVMGTKEMKDELRLRGIKVTDSYNENIGGVIIGYDTELVYQKLIDVTKLLNQGKLYLATNPDLVCPVEYGFIPDCGSFAMMLENATKRKPIFIGKPDPAIIDMIIERTGYAKEETVLVGDRLYTDIKCGINAGIDTILVLSGETKLADVAVSSDKPTLVVEDVAAILELIS
jgi:HAD superfamily hydrolase (TIGR01457 family)